MDRSSAILKHIGLYRVTLRTVLDRLFFDGKEGGCKNVLSQLKSSGFVRAVARNVAGRSYYMLTPAGAARAGVPETRTNLGTQAVPTHLGILSFCCLARQRRYRLEDSELAELFPSPPEGNHALAKGPDDPCVYHIYVSSGARERALRTIREHLEEARANLLVGDWIRSRQYGFAVLHQDASFCHQLNSALKAPNGNEPSLWAQARFLVETTVYSGEKPA